MGTSIAVTYQIRRLISVAEWETYFADGGTRAQMIIGAYMMMLSAIAFVWFARSLVASFLPVRPTQSASTLFVAMVL